MSAKPKVLITAAVHPYLPARFGELGWEVTIIEDIGRDHLLEIMPQYEALIITTYVKADRALLDQAVTLRLIGRVGSGMENIDLPYAQEKGIRCFNSPEGNANAVGEHTLGLLLNLLHKISSSAASLKHGRWDREAFRGIELTGKTVGIIGCGHTGSAFAKKLSGFDVRIIAYDPYKKAFPAGMTPADLTAIRAEADIISFHVPYNSETHHYISDDFIAGCKKRPILLNTSRGAVADTPAVLRALQNGRISGFGVDVYEDEPLDKNQVHPSAVYHQLIAHEQVIATPHIAGWTLESKYLLAKVLMDKLEPFLTF